MPRRFGAAGERQESASDTEPVGKPIAPIATAAPQLRRSSFRGAFATFVDYPLDLRRPEPQQTSHTDAAKPDTGAPCSVVDCSRCDAERVSGLPWIEEIFHGLLCLYPADRGGRNEAVNVEKRGKFWIC